MLITDATQIASQFKNDIQRKTKMRTGIRYLSEAEVAHVSGGLVTGPDIIVNAHHESFNLGTVYSPRFVGINDNHGGGGTGFSFTGPYAMASIWGVIQWATDKAIDIYNGQADKKAAAEKAISSQFDPHSVSVFGADPNGIQYRIMNNGDVFIDTDKNGSYDTITRRGGDGHIYRDTGDGRGFVDTTTYWSNPK